MLLSHPAVAEAGVVGMTDDKWGQVPAAFVVKSGEVTEEEILHFCEEKLAKYKVPKKSLFLRGITTKCFEKIVKTRVKTISGGDVSGDKKKRHFI